MKITLRNHTPNLAETVAARLRGRGIPWEGGIVYPSLAIAKTGRIYTQRPNVQGDGKRLDKVAAGLPVGWYAIEADFRRAEPTVLQHMLKSERLFTDAWPNDIYQSLATVCGITRDESKEVFLRIMYSPNTRAAFRNLGTALEHPFWGSLAEAVEKLKDRVWSKGKPRKNGRRFTTTLGGTRIEALKGEPMRKGKLLSWTIQGTVADILNQAMTALLDREAEGKWEVLFPIHDSVMVKTNGDRAEEIANVLTETAKNHGLEMEVTKESKTGGQRAQPKHPAKAEDRNPCNIGVPILGHMPPFLLVPILGHEHRCVPAPYYKDFPPSSFEPANLPRETGFQTIFMKVKALTV